MPVNIEKPQRFGVILRPATRECVCQLSCTAACPNLLQLAAQCLHLRRPVETEKKTPFSRSMPLQLLDALDTQKGHENQRQKHTAQTEKTTLETPVHTLVTSIKPADNKAGKASRTPAPTTDEEASKHTELTHRRQHTVLVQRMRLTPTPPSHCASTADRAEGCDPETLSVDALLRCNHPWSNAYRRGMRHSNCSGSGAD